MWGRYGCSLWKSIHKVFFFFKFICFKKGLSRNTSFGEDRWMEKVPLKESFTTLFSLVVDSRVLVAESYDVLGNLWVPRLHRNLNDWEMGELCSLLSLLDGLKLNPSLRVDWEWFISRKGRFSSIFLSLELVNFRTFPFHHKGILIPGIPSKASFYM